MENTNGANVTITLELYTELVCKDNDLEKVKRFSRTAKMTTSVLTAQG